MTEQGSEIPFGSDSIHGAVREAISPREERGEYSDD